MYEPVFFLHSLRPTTQDSRRQTGQIRALPKVQRHLQTIAANGDSGSSHCRGGSGLGGATISGRALEHLKGLNNLEKLFLPGIHLDDGALANLAELPKLKELHIQGANISEENFKQIAALGNLETLDVGGSYSIKGPGLEQLAALKKLRSLDLHSSSIDDTGVVHLRWEINIASTEKCWENETNPALRRMTSWPGGLQGLICVCRPKSIFHPPRRLGHVESSRRR
jgi:Leucine-rich repeat (LRR) protein